MCDVAGVALLVDDGAVVVPEDSPSPIKMSASFMVGMLGGNLLIHFDSPSRLVTGVEIPVLICCAPLKDFRLEALDDAAPLDAETAARWVQMKLRRLAHRRHVGWAVPRGLDSKIFSRGSDFVGRRR